MKLRKPKDPFVAIVTLLLTDPVLRALAAYGSAALADNPTQFSPLERIQKGSP